jgi:hypothetical protein
MLDFNVDSLILEEEEKQYVSMIGSWSRRDGSVESSVAETQ